MSQTTPGFNDPSKPLYDLAAAQFARVLVAEFGLTQAAAEQWVAENVDVRSLVDQFLFVDSGGDTFVRGKECSFYGDNLIDFKSARKRS